MTAEEEENLTDPERLMEGEDPDSDNLEDAEHWLATYSELLGFKDRLLREAENGTSELSDTSQEEAMRDLSLLDKEKARLVNRYVFWRDKVQELRKS